LWSLRERHPQVAERLSVHFLLPPRGNACPLRPLPPGNCSEPPNNFEEAVRSAAAYPVNAARNVARRLAKTKLVLVADLDHLFSANFAPKMAALAKKELSENPKRALVYRIFEIEKDVQRFPETKADLSALYQSGQAAVFHKHYYAHRIPLLAEWFEAPETGPDETPSVQFVRPYNVSAWEPQFVSLATIPDHDESFPYPVRDNTVLRWEMCRTGFEFAIVHDVFMFHHGVKKAEESRIVTSARQRVQKRASAALTSFTARMRREHPDTEQDCPVFQL
uniref:Beta-1,4-glucuronyltransferase 1 n=1 Tax=Steinernema glaseri TaxID=37863 RepID=A0A1I8ANX3_9BILA